MFRKILVSLLSFGLLVTTQFTIRNVTAADRSIQLYVKDVKVAGVHPIIISGVMYVPFRSFLTALGYDVAYDTVTRRISGVIRDSEIEFWAGDDVLEFEGAIYYLDQAIPVLNGQVYLPIRLVSKLADYSVNYDKSNFDVRLKPYGYGEESAIKDLLTKYYETASPSLLTFDNLRLRYMIHEYDRPVSEIKVHTFKVTTDWIEYTSATEAKVRVTYNKNSEVLNRSDVFLFDIRYETGQWKISNEAMIFNSLEIPVDIDKQAASIKDNYYNEHYAVLSDLKTYYKAVNEEDIELTVKYTDPLMIEQWNDNEFNSTFAGLIKVQFASYDHRYILSNERVVYLGNNEAVVLGNLKVREGNEEGVDDYEYESLFYLKYANGHWTFSENINLDQDFDERVDSLGNPAKLSGW